MSGEDDDIILADLDDEELVAQMYDDLYDGMKAEIDEGTAHSGRSALVDFVARKPGH
jgi:hypothetical protein